MLDVISNVGGFDYERQNDYIYIASAHTNSICRIDLISNEVKLLFYSPKDRYTKSFCWSKSARIDNRILFAPCSGSRFCMLDLENEECRDITPLNHDFDFLSSMEAKFWEVASFRRDFYIFGFQWPGIIKINADTYEFSLFDYSEISLGKDEYSEQFLVSDGYVQLGDKLYLPAGTKGSLLQFDPIKGELHEVNTRERTGRAQGISGDDECIWITGINPTVRIITIWNVYTHTERTIRMPEEGRWFAPVFYGGKAYLFPISDGAGVYEIDLNSLAVKTFERLNVLFIKKEKEREIETSAITVKLYKNEVTFIRRMDHVWFTYNFDTDELSERVFRLCNGEYMGAAEKEYYDNTYEFFKEKRFLMNEDVMPIFEFLRRI